MDLSAMCTSNMYAGSPEMWRFLAVTFYSCYVWGDDGNEVNDWMSWKLPVSPLCLCLLHSRHTTNTFMLIQHKLWSQQYARVSVTRTRRRWFNASESFELPPPALVSSARGQTTLEIVVTKNQHSHRRSEADFLLGDDYELLKPFGSTFQDTCTLSKEA